jgi:hypothetical protein
VLGAVAGLYLSRARRADPVPPLAEGAVVRPGEA